MKMGKRKTIVTALSGVLVGGMLLSGGLVFAGDTDSSVSTNLAGKIPFFGQAMKHWGGSDSLKTLVDKGTITQEQSDKILKKLEDVQKDREALFEKMQGMTMEERRQYIKDNKEKPQDPISQLVADGTITENQAKAIRDILPHRKGGQGGPGGQGFKGFKGGRR